MGDSRGNSEVKSDWPKRSFMADPTIQWRLGHAPDYTKVDTQFMAERTRHHKPGSVEETVENLVKTWEMEASHKLDPKVNKKIHDAEIAPLGFSSETVIPNSKSH